MNQSKIYKITPNQFKLIVESQKSSPQLQTEILDNTVNAFGQLLTWGFKQTVNAFKYMNGIGVDIYQGDTFTENGKVKVKKNNPLAPLSLYKPVLAGLPQGYQNLFTTIYKGVKASGDIKPPNENDTEDDDEFNDLEDDNKKTFNDLSGQLTFDDVDVLTYRLKFEFQNLNKNAKENNAIMSTTWALVFNVDCSGKAIENSTMTFKLNKFTSEGPSLERVFSQMTQGKKPGEFDKNFANKMASNLGSGSEFSLIFNSDAEANKFKTAMKKQIGDHMKIMIGQLNSKMGVKDVIKPPQVIIDVDYGLIGNSQNKPTVKHNIKDIENDILEINRQVELYQTQTEYKTYVEKLLQIRNKLLLMRQQINSTS